MITKEQHAQPYFLHPFICRAVLSAFWTRFVIKVIFALLWKSGFPSSLTVVAAAA